MKYSNNFSMLLCIIGGLMAGANSVAAATIDKVADLPANSQVSIPDMGIKGITNATGTLNIPGASCEEGKVYTALSNGQEFKFTCNPENFFGVKETIVIVALAGAALAAAEVNGKGTSGTSGPSGPKSVTQSCVAAANPCALGTCPTSITMTGFAPATPPYTGFNIDFGAGAGAMTGAPASPDYIGNGFTLPTLGGGYTCNATWGNGADETGGVSIFCSQAAFFGQFCSLGCGGAPAFPIQ